MKHLRNIQHSWWSHPPGFPHVLSMLLWAWLSSIAECSTDVLHFDRHGCDSPVAKKFFANVENYANNLGNASFWGEVEKRAYGK